jgi:serine/threonine protein kinase
MFLPKYYLLAEKDNSYENDLLVDYIGHPNLSDYIDKNRSTLSLNTKIYFVLMIAQALRYLKEYRIAHLDLKPSNIMTHRRLNLKLIDFGESYHPELLKSIPDLTQRISPAFPCPTPPPKITTSWKATTPRTMSFLWE